MAMSNASTVQQYLKELPDERRAAISAVRKVIRAHLPAGFEEVMNWGMITYQVPMKRYPDTYNKKPLCMAALAAQKNHLAVYLMGPYTDKKTEKWFLDQYKKSGKKLNMGKSCLRFRKADDLPLDLIGEVISKHSVDEFIDRYEKSRGK